MSKNCFGIISYLPDDKEVRTNRIKLMVNLLRQCYRFDWDIIIVAQNWTTASIENPKVHLYHFDKLGITGARKKLREIFLASDYDNLIMLDDDCHIWAKDSGIQAYKDELEAHPNSIGLFRHTVLKLFSISKELLAEVDYEDFEAEKGECFEDTIFVNKLMQKFPDKIFAYRCRYHGIDEDSVNAEDPNSTWYKEQNLKEMLDRTHKFVDDLKK